MSPGATWSPTAFITDDVSPLQDGINLGSVVVDETVGSVILIYSVCFHLYHCKPSSTMMIESRDDGLSWSLPRNLSDQIGVQSFAPGPGFGIQVRGGHPTTPLTFAQYSAATSFLLSLHCRSATNQPKGGWWCAVTARWKETVSSAY